MEPLLEINHVNYAYHSMQGETPALQNIHFTVCKGDFIAVVGPSGCGKSTLLSLIAGLLAPEEGEILLNGKRIQEHSNNPIGYMLQKDHLLEWRTIWKNIQLGLEIQGNINSASTAYANSLLKNYGLYEFKDKRPSELSGGIICDGLGSSFAAALGVLPNTSFAQNVGIISMTKIVNRMALSCGAIFLILCGLCPKIAAFVSIMPQSVLGGAAVMMFASILVSGIQLITKEPITSREITIVSVALGLGYGLGSTAGATSELPYYIQLIFGGSGIVPAAVAAIVLNIIIPKEKKKAE